MSGFNSEQLQSLRDAMKVYAYEGYHIHDMFKELNEKSTVYIEF